VRLGRISDVGKVYRTVGEELFVSDEEKNVELFLGKPCSGRTFLPLIIEYRRCAARVITSWRHYDVKSNQAG
jgi:hypothetical protein